MDKRAKRLLGERVDRGFALLSRQLGDEWPMEIDQDLLQMHDGKRCIVGQLAVTLAHKHLNGGFVDRFGDGPRPHIAYDNVIPLMFDRPDRSIHDRWLTRQATSHGFNTPETERHGYEYEDLNEAWLDRLREWHDANVHA